MSKVIPVRLISLARTTADWHCPRSRYLGYEIYGRGITKNTTSLELFIGTTIHDALATIASLIKEGKPIDIDQLAATSFKQIYQELIELAEGVIETEAENFANEQASLVEGMIRGFYGHVWPRLMVQYPKIVAIEQEFDYTLTDGLKFRCKPDLIVEDQEGQLVYLEYKTTSSKKPAWVNSWDTAVQLHSSCKAAEQSLDRKVEYVQIIGLYKGYESYGKQGSPFCYAYKKSGNPPFTKDQINYEYRSGFKRFPVWEVDGGVKGWIAAMPENVLADQFPLTAPILVNEDLVNAFFRQRATREAEIAAVTSTIATEELNQEVMDTYFPQRFDQCQPSFGFGCPFKPICHGEIRNPLEDGYTLREPHYKEEREALGLDNDQ